VLNTDYLANPIYSVARGLTVLNQRTIATTVIASLSVLVVVPEIRATSALPLVIANTATYVSSTMGCHLFVELYTIVLQQPGRSYF
jgi:hypothetical protein